VPLTAKSSLSEQVENQGGESADSTGTLPGKTATKWRKGHVVKHCNVVVITRTRQPYTLSAVQMVTSSVVYVALIR